MVDEDCPGGSSLRAIGGKILKSMHRALPRAMPRRMVVLGRFSPFFFYKLGYNRKIQ